MQSSVGQKNIQQPQVISQCNTCQAQPQPNTQPAQVAQAPVE